MKKRHLSFPISPGCVVNQGLGLVLGELVGLELVDRGYAGPAVFCGRACGGIAPVKVKLGHASWRGLFTEPHAGVNMIKG